MSAEDNAERAIDLVNRKGNGNVVAHGNSGAAVTLSTPGTTGDSSNTVTLTANSVAVTVPAPREAGEEFDAILSQDATGSRVPAFTGSTITWVGGAPTFTTTASRSDRITLKSYDGTSWVGNSALNIH